MAEDVSQPPRASTSLNSPPTTPPQPDQQPDPTSSTSNATAQPHDTIPYSAAFTDSLMTHILSQPAPQSQQSTSRRAKQSFSSRQQGDTDPKAIHITASSSDAPTSTRSKNTSTNTTALSDIDASRLPSIQPYELPLSIDDPRRLYASSIPGLRLTHPGGYLEGGPSPATQSLVLLSTGPAASDSQSQTQAPSQAQPQTQTQTQAQPHVTSPSAPPAFAHAFLAENNIRTGAELRQAVAAASAAQIEELRRRMAERQDALRRNERLQREIDELVAEREMERRVHERHMKLRKERMGAAEG